MVCRDGEDARARPNPDAPQHFYDYRGAFREGAKPDAEGHWPSKFKREGHPRMVVDGVNTKTGVPEDGRSGLARAVDLATTPLVPQLATGAARVADAIDTAPRQTQGGLLDALMAVPDVARNLLANPLETGRGLLAGAVEGAGQVASQLTSPLDLALTATGLRGVRSAAPLISRGVDVAGNTALALRGAERVADADTPSDAGTGILQAALGAAGAQTARLRPIATAGRVASPAAVVEPSAPVPAPQPQRRRDLLTAVNARDAFHEPSRLNAIRVAADSGEILSRPTTATPRVVKGLTRRPSMAAEAAKPADDAVRQLEDVPAVRSGHLTPEQAGFLKWLSDDLTQHTFQQGGRPGATEFIPSPHSAGTPTQKTFNALGIDATRGEIGKAIESLLEGRSRGGAIENAALPFVDLMREGWDGHGFDWSKVSKESRQRAGLRSVSELKSPLEAPEAVFQDQGPETREYFAPRLREGETDLIPSRPVIIEGLRRRRPSEDIRTSQPISDPLAHVEPSCSGFRNNCGRGSARCSRTIKGLRISGGSRCRLV